jgi:hypothetical protein
VGPPPFAEQFCCNYGCTKCIQHQCPTGKQCGIFVCRDPSVCPKLLNRLTFSVASELLRS